MSGSQDQAVHIFAINIRSSEYVHNNVEVGIHIGKVANFDHVPNFDHLPRKADFLKNNENWRKPLGIDIHTLKETQAIYFSPTQLFALV